MSDFSDEDFEEESDTEDLNIPVLPDLVADCCNIVEKIRKRDYEMCSFLTRDLNSTHIRLMLMKKKSSKICDLRLSPELPFKA